MADLIFLFTDFGYQGPYVGELHAVFQRAFPDLSVIDLLHDAPAFNPQAGSYLLAALAKRFQQGDVCLAVVDPGVGMPERRAIIIEADGVIFCGPDNGLLSQVVQHASKVIVNEIIWRPMQMSTSFHGRDLFAPAIVRYLAKANLALQALSIDELIGMDWAPDVKAVIYLDQFGNAMTGLRSEKIPADTRLIVDTTEVRPANTFAEVPVGEVFWYANSLELVEIAVNQGSAREKLGLYVGSPISIAPDSG